MSHRVRHAIDALEKRAGLAQFAQNIGKGLANHAGATTGAVAGGLYGGIQGAQGEQGGVSSAISGMAQGALGGAIAGHVGTRMFNAVKGVNGKPGVFGQYGQAKKNFDAAAGVQDGQTMLGRMGRRSDYKARTADAREKLTTEMRMVQDKADASLINATDATKQMDNIIAQDPLLALRQARQRITYGGVGGAFALGTGAGLVRSGANAGQSDDQRIADSLRAKYNETGKLDEREMNLLRSKMTRLANKQQQGAGGTSAV
jgi:hypothetical protein